MEETNELIKRVKADYFKHIDNLQDNDYSSIYMLIEMLEDEWNGQGANLNYDINIVKNNLCLENIQLCKMEELIYCEVESDSIIYHLKDNRDLYIVIQWISEKDAFISQIYIENSDNTDGKILYRR